MASVSVRRGGSVRDVTAALVDSSGGVIPVASEFLSYVSLRGCSPNTVLTYAYDLAHLWRFLVHNLTAVDRVREQLVDVPAREGFVAAFGAASRRAALGPEPEAVGLFFDPAHAAEL